MTRFVSILRALVIASVIPLVLIVAHFALTTFALSPADALALDAFASAASLALLAFAVAALGREPIAQRLGLRAGRLSPGRVAAGALGIVALSHAAEGILAWSGVTSPGLARFDDALTGLPLDRIAVPLFVLAIASAVGEELFFRGLLQRGLAPLGRGFAIVFAAVAFGAAHGDLAHAAAAALLGLYLGVLADRADSIRPVIVAHGVNNALALFEVATGLRIPEGRFVTPISVTLALAVACVALHFAMRSPPGPDLQSPVRSADG